MPQKLNIGESLAFLIACIDAAGKLDFKRLGDALEIQPAAARMRLTRLRKAVTSKEFEDCLLVQPNKPDAEIVAIANPESKKLAEAARKARKSKSANKRKSRSELSSSVVVDEDSDLDEEEADEEEEIDDGHKEPSSRQHSMDVDESNLKRKASQELQSESDDDTPLFYEDTSAASRKIKQMKMADDSSASKNSGKPEYQDQATSLARNIAGYNASHKLRRPGHNVHLSSSQIMTPSGNNNRQSAPLPTTVPQHMRHPQIPSRQGLSSPQPAFPLGAYRPYTTVNSLGPSYAHAQWARIPGQPYTRGPLAPVDRRSLGSEWSAAEYQPQRSPSPSESVTTSKKLNLSEPGSIFGNFKPPTQSPFLAELSAMKQTPDLSTRQAQPPVTKARPQRAGSTVPDHLMDPALRTFDEIAQGGSIVDHTSPELHKKQAHTSINSKEQNTRIKQEEDEQLTGSRTASVATADPASYGVNIISRAEWDAAEQPEEVDDLEYLKNWQLP